MSNVKFCMTVHFSYSRKWPFKIYPDKEEIAFTDISQYNE